VLEKSLFVQIQLDSMFYGVYFFFVSFVVTGKTCQNPKIKDSQCKHLSKAQCIYIHRVLHARVVGSITGDANQLLARSVGVRRAPLNRLMHRPSTPSLALKVK